MNKLAFIFLCGFYVTLSILSFTETLPIEGQLVICVSAIALLGIPHGAIDHLLFLKKSTISSFRFFSLYILAMGVYLLLWYLFPVFALSLFLLLSAYHFGESQLCAFSKYLSRFSIYAYLLWGANILSALVFYHASELRLFFSNTPDLSPLLPAFTPLVHQYILVFSTIALALSFIYLFQKHKLRLDLIAKEIVVLVLIHLAFYILPILAGFTLYFVILHSLKVLLEEYDFLKKEIIHFSKIDFISKLAPFSILSLVGAAILFYLSHIGQLNVSLVLLSIILISVISLPHAVVMHKFYKD